MFSKRTAHECVNGIPGCPNGGILTEDDVRFWLQATEFGMHEDG